MAHTHTSSPLHHHRSFDLRERFSLNLNDDQSILVCPFSGSNIISEIGWMVGDWVVGGVGLVVRRNYLLGIGLTLGSHIN